MIDVLTNQLNLLNWGMVFATMFAGVMTSVIGLGGAIVVGIFLSLAEYGDFSRVIYQTIVISSNCFMSVVFYYFSTSKKVDFKLVISILPAALSGVFLGFYILYRFHEIADFSRLMYVFILTFLGIHGLYLNFSNEEQRVQKGLQTINRLLPLKFEMEALSFPISYVLMFFLCFGIYTLSTIAGIGGNAMLITLMIYFLGVKENFLLPSLLTISFVATATAASLDLNFFFSALDMSIIYSLLVGSFLGTFVGVKISKFVSLKKIKLTVPIAMIVLAIISLIMDTTLGF